MGPYFPQRCTRTSLFPKVSRPVCVHARPIGNDTGLAQLHITDEVEPKATGSSPHTSAQPVADTKI